MDERASGGTGHDGKIGRAERAIRLKWELVGCAELPGRALSRKVIGRFRGAYSCCYRFLQCLVRQLLLAPSARVSRDLSSGPSQANGRCGPPHIAWGWLLRPRLGLCTLPTGARRPRARVRTLQGAHLSPLGLHGSLSSFASPHPRRAKRGLQVTPGERQHRAGWAPRRRGLSGARQAARRCEAGTR